MKRLLLALVALLASPAAMAQDCAGPAAVCEQGAQGAMQLVGGGAVRILVAGDEQPGVRDAADDLGADLLRVAGKAEAAGTGTDAIIVGTLDSSLIRPLVAAGKIDTAPIRGHWEGFVQQIVDNPAPGVRRALVIAGADRRGAIFGAYDLSRRIGVSPWSWWADVPVRKRARLFVLPGARIEMPGVKYRGIFLNDEEPALGNWARGTFGGINAKFYERVFELILRLKGNYLWPAMWGKSLWDDDPASAALAERMGVVLGTSHHEPMLRAHVEWERHGKGPWDYTKNAEALRAFWREGLVRNAGREALVTVGMRGDGDEPMTEGTATALLERIVADQRKIIEAVTGRPAADTPQVWALYKEVQDYYDKGMRVPDDVTLLFSDDNWGNIRRLPKPGEKRAGGFGVYYHFDYVGGPRNYKWLNTNQISRTWEQMHLAWKHGADRLWIVNVGDLKPMELPTSFFLDMAWNPDAMPLEAMAGYHKAWAAEQFGADHAGAIGELLDLTTRYLARRKPELIDAGTYSLAEWEVHVGAFDALEKQANRIAAKLPAGAQDAYYQLVLHPIEAAGNLHRLYQAVALNRFFAEHGDGRANDWAKRAEGYFAKDAEIRRRYESRAGGKWAEMMSQTHIGYTSWQQPDRDVMPEVRRVPANAPRNTPLPVPPADPAVTIDAAHAARSVPTAGAQWRVIPGLGKTGAAVTPWPQIAPSAAPGKGPRLEFDVTLDAAGDFTLEVLASPSLDVTGGRGLRYAVSIDDAPPQVIDLWANTTEADWNRAVADSVRRTVSTHRVAAGGRHVVKLWMIDPGVVIQQLVLRPVR
ncbi:MAG TPA: glycosyl hydrolase 115 family protein [Sphingomonas sp.]|nr:glycosyl hydrolase 115 family protein [Sphingomonas sp.]